MKLTKYRLLKVVRNDLMDLGFIEIKTTSVGTDGLFIKKKDLGYYLMLGLTISRFYDSSFTASFYVSRSTRYGSVWGDIPPESYKRIGHFLTREERKELLDDEFNKPGVVDAWWNGIDDLTVSKFILAIKRSEKRFLAQPGLFNKIDASLEIKKFSDQVTMTMNELSSDTLKEGNFHFLPTRVVDDIPLNWFMASEKALVKSGSSVNTNLVKLLAVDAWNKFMLPIWLQTLDNHV